MSLRRVFALTLRIIRQFGRDRRSLALLFVAPLLVMTLLNFLLDSGNNGVTLGIVAPTGPTGQIVLAQISARLGSQPGVTVRPVARDGVDTAIKDGDADGVLIFPANYSPADPTAQVTLRLDGANPGAARQIQALVSQLLASLPSAQAAGAGSAGSAGSAALTVSYLYGGPQYTETDALAPLFIAVFAFFFVFLLTSVSFLRERSQGTIERLMVSPLSKAELVLGYVLGFTLFALLQSLLILLFVVFVLRVHYAGNLGLIFLVTLALTIGAVNMGIFASAFARNELQVIQFIPLLLVPQVLLGGLFFPVQTLPVVLKQLAYVFPLTYADSALQGVMLKNFGFGDIWPNLAFVAGFALVMVLAAALSLRQERV